MKAHIFRELVNDLRDIATQWHGSQQLRERISGRLRQDVSIDEDPANDGWIPWAGTTKYPTDIQPHTNVEVKLRCGETVERLAYSFDWTIDGTTGDIIAYRIVRK